MPELPPGALAPLGWDDRVAALYAEVDQPDVVPGRVVRVERTSVIVATADGDLIAHPAAAAVGDWAALRRDRDRATVVATLPRWSQLTRRDPSGRGDQVLAVNVDLVLVTAPADRLSAARVEREIVVAWDSGARPVVLVTKSDLAADDLPAALADRLVGVDVHAVSTVTGVGLDAVTATLAPGRTAVLIGPSGAGKSTLANALIGERRFATAAVRPDDHRGRHTTTSRQLVVVPSGGVLIDTPGLRSLGLAADGDAVAIAFEDIAALATGCRFADCRHDREPGCAVLEAVNRRALDPGRLASYRKLGREIAFEARRTDPLLRQADRRRWKLVVRQAHRRSRP